MLAVAGEASGLRYTEVDVLGIYISPMALMLLGAWVITLALRRADNWIGLLRCVWHPALFVFCIYLIVLSAIVVVVSA